VATAVDEFEFFLEKGWSDGLPVVTPTETRVAAMLAGTRRDPGDVIGRIPPALETATVRVVAVHAVMAGCRPEYLPVVLGGLHHMLRDEFNLNGVQGTMHGVAPLMIVNGPYASRIGIHGGNGCFGPGFRANATIGRAIRLLLLNLGGGIAGIAAEDLGVGPMPGPTVNPGVQVGGATLWIAADKGDEQTAAAWDYIKFLVEPEVQSRWAAATGYVPVRQSSVDIAPISTTYVSDPRFKVAFDQLVDPASDVAANGPVLGPLREIRVVTSRAVQEALTGGDPAAALSVAAAQADALIAAYNANAGR